MRVLTIKDGPSISKLLAAFHDSFANPPETESFKISDFRVSHLQLQIVGIEHNGGLPGLYNMRGNILSEAYGFYTFTAFYDANIRQGCIKIYKKDELPEPTS
jgi:hypothetical protein